MYQSRVLVGQKIGRTIDFPTINLNPTVLPRTTKKGVYGSWVTVLGKTFKGALYYGPRLVFNETKTVLEIYLIGFTGELYNEEVEFTIEDFIRPPMNFRGLDTLKSQLKKDVADVQEVLSNKA